MFREGIQQCENPRVKVARSALEARIHVTRPGGKAPRVNRRKVNRNKEVCNFLPV